MNEVMRLSISSSIAMRSLLVVVALMLVSCSEPVAPVRISINAWPGYEFLFLAQEKGFFKAEGVDVQLVEFGSLSDTRRAFERGSIDGLAGTVIEILQSQDAGSRIPQIIMVVDYSDGADYVLAQPDITAVAQLKGRRVGLELASLGVFILARMLEQAGMQLSDVEMVSSDQSSMEEMFNRHELDAVVTYPPVAVSLLENSSINTLFTSAKIPGEVIDVVALDSELVRQYPQKASAIIRGFYRAIDYAKQHPDESYQLMAKREGISAAEFRAALDKDIHMLSLNEQAGYFGAENKLQANIQTVSGVLHSTGQLKSAVDPASMINAKPLQALKAEK